MDKFRLILVAALPLFPLSGIAQKVEIYTDGGVVYAAINTDGMPRRTEDRNSNSDFYADANLFTYSSDGKTSTQITDSEGNPVIVKRVKRHYTGDNSHLSSGDYNVSARFIVSPTNVYSDGATDNTKGGVATANWATANGYLATANTNSYTTVGTSATPMGCFAYRGKDGTDGEGTWRVPTHKEGDLIAIFYKDLENTSAKTGFKPFAVGTGSTYYWLATEESNTSAWCMMFFVDSKASQYQIRTNTKTSGYYIRCIRDIGGI